MIEKELYEYMVNNIYDAEITWGKLDKSTKFNDLPIINFIKVPSQTSNTSPTFYDSIQISIRHEYIDKVQEYMNNVIELFQLFVGYIGEYHVWVSSVVINGISYEEEDIVSGNVTIGLKYTIL